MRTDPRPNDWSAHTAFSDPGRHRPLLQALPGDIESTCRAARNVIGHYRVELTDLPADRHDEVDDRWLEAILERDQERHGVPLLDPRRPDLRIAGCCRDHSLFVVAALRERGVPARTRVGFANYLTPGYQIDHVIVEYWNGRRWTRVDPELQRGSVAFDVEDLPIRAEPPFQCAAAAWLGNRRGLVDDRCYCVFPGSRWCGDSLIRRYVLYDLMHRQGDEVLLWDEWDLDEGRLTVEAVDTVTELLLAADSGDQRAEQALREQHRCWRPAGWVTQHSPFGDPPVRVALRPDVRR